MLNIVDVSDSPFVVMVPEDPVHSTVQVPVTETPLPAVVKLPAIFAVPPLLTLIDTVPADGAAISKFVAKTVVFHVTV